MASPHPARSSPSRRNERCCSPSQKIGFFAPTLLRRYGEDETPRVLRTKPRRYHTPSSYYSMIARLAFAEDGVACEPVFAAGWRRRSHLMLHAAGQALVVLGIMASMLWLAGCARQPPGFSSTRASPRPVDRAFPLVFFDWDSSRLSSRAEQIIGEIGEHYIEFQKQEPSPLKIYVMGFTDASGPVHYNFLLGLRRAERVALELERLGWNRKYIVVRSCGAAHPLVPTPRGVQEPQNRRVEFPLIPVEKTWTCRGNSR